jgi:hypothetical protein
MNIKWPSLVAGILLVLAILNIWPYDFYIILRWIVCGVAIYNAFKYYEANLTGWVFVFGALAFLFNPLFPIYMNKSAWVGIDLIAAIIFFLSAYSNIKK